MSQRGTSKLKRIIIAGGGTGGHIFPAIAIAHALREQLPDCMIRFVGAKGKMEMQKVPEAGYSIEGIAIAGFNRSSLFKNISLPLKLVQSFWQVRSIFRRFRPDAVVGVGGYASFPVLRYAQWRKVPTFIHEANAFAGKSNVLLGKRAVKVFAGSAGLEKFFPPGKVLFTGNPVRKEVSLPAIRRDEAIRSFGLDPGKKTVLVTGGSLGAKGINDAIIDQVSLLRDNDLQLIWQTGTLYESKARQVCHTVQGCWTGAFIKEIQRAYAAADVVVSRAGAMTIAELCVTGKPAVFVPYPFAAEDHQTVNAQHLVQNGAAIMVPDHSAAKSLLPAVVALVNDAGRLLAMAQAMKKMAVNDADYKIADAIITYFEN